MTDMRGQIMTTSMEKIFVQTLVSRLNQSESNSSDDIAVSIVDETRYCENISEVINLFRKPHSESNTKR